MSVRWLFAALHLLGLGIGLSAAWGRGWAFRGTLDSAGLKRVYAADIWWAVAGVLWISTGLTRLFASMEKSTAYYLDNRLFWTKMSLLAIIIALEIPTAITLVRWRLAAVRGRTPNTQSARVLSAMSFAQALLVLLMLVVATGMARGYGA